MNAKVGIISHCHGERRRLVRPYDFLYARNLQADDSMQHVLNTSIYVHYYVNTIVNLMGLRFHNLSKNHAFILEGQQDGAVETPGVLQPDDPGLKPCAGRAFSRLKCPSADH